MPVRSPGRKKVAMAVKTKFLSSHPGKTAEQRPNPLPTSVNKQAKKMTMNRGEKKPPLGRILQGPTFRLLARPREEVITELEKARKKPKLFRVIIGSKGL